jgi:hypothetical protein
MQRTKIHRIALKIISEELISRITTSLPENYRIPVPGWLLL